MSYATIVSAGDTTPIIVQNALMDPTREVADEGQGSCRWDTACYRTIEEYLKNG